MRETHPTIALRFVIISAMVFGLVAPSTFAATIQTTGRVTGNWSSPSIWQSGVVPGPSDVAMVTPSNAIGPFQGSRITYDSAALGTVGSISANQLTLTLGRDLVAQNLYLRECTVADGGHNLSVSGTLSNYLIEGYEGNGGIRTGQGGNLFLGNLTLGRTGLYTFYPGDTISGNYTTHRIRNTWPDITVTQDPVAYGDRLDKGLSFDGAASQLSLGRTSATDQSEITLSWDDGMTGTIDWTLRWKGDHVADLRGYHANGQIKIGKVPTGMTFDPKDNIFFDSATGYTYVGFKHVAQATYDAARDFSSSSNPNGVWQYGWMPAAGGAFQLYTNKLLSPTLNRWNSQPSQDFWLSIYQNPSATPDGNPADWLVEPGAMILHPGPQNQRSVVRFTAPAAGTYTLDARFSLIDRQANGTPAVNVGVSSNSGEEVTQLSDELNTYPDSKSLRHTLRLASGDTVDVFVGYGAGPYYDDGTRLELTIMRL